jgi:hypothetical protein
MKDSFGVLATMPLAGTSLREFVKSELSLPDPRQKGRQMFFAE